LVECHVLRCCNGRARQRRKDQTDADLFSTNQ
jgi:hypothetical protein